MAYTTQEKIENKAPRGFLDRVLKNVIGKTKEELIADMIEEAEDEINGALVGKYAVPIAADLPPGYIEQKATRIAIYRGASHLSAETDEFLKARRDYEDCLSWLKRVQDGKVTLDLPKPTSDSSTEDMTLTDRQNLNVSFADHRGVGGSTLDGLSNRPTRQPWQGVDPVE